MGAARGITRNGDVGEISFRGSLVVQARAFRSGVNPSRSFGEGNPADVVHTARTGEEPRSSAKAALDMVRTVEAVDRSLDVRGAPVAVESSEPVAA